jgi:hypothetical protein
MRLRNSQEFDIPHAWMTGIGKYAASSAVLFSAVPA